MTCQRLANREEQIFGVVVRALRQSELRCAATILRRKRRLCTRPVRELSLSEDLNITEENLPEFFTALGEILLDQETLPMRKEISVSIRPRTMDELYFYLLELSGFSTK